MRKMPYRLLCTATAAPNDYIELGTSSEALGELGYMDMLQRFFKNDQNNSIKPTIYRNRGQNFQQLDDRQNGVSKDMRRFLTGAGLPHGHALAVSPQTWVLMTGDLFCRRSSEQYTVESRTLPDGALFPMPAVRLPEQREERRRTIQERCEKVAELVDDGEQALIWCHLNDEGNLLEDLILDATGERRR